jgi:uncharacterized protein DUF6941
VKVTLLLADFAEAINGKLYVMGGGWSITAPAPGPMALAVKIEVPWNEANKSHELTMQLVDADGQPVVFSPEEEGKAGAGVEVKGDFEVGRPPGLMPGTPIDLAMGINIGRGPLEPSTRYTWRLSIDGYHDEDWEVSFSTRAE